MSIWSEVRLLGIFGGHFEFAPYRSYAPLATCLPSIFLKADSHFRQIRREISGTYSQHIAFVCEDI